MFKSLLIVLALTASVTCLEGVVDLTDANFDEKVKQDQSFWLVLFAADWVLYYRRSVATVSI